MQISNHTGAIYKLGRLLVMRLSFVFTSNMDIMYYMPWRLPY